MVRQFGRKPSTFDEKDWNLRDFMPWGAPFRLVNESNWEYPAEPLDQGGTAHCVGFSMATFGINLPVHTPFTNTDGHTFYYQCKVVDGYPGSEDGSTIRSAAKVLKNNRRIEGYAFASDMSTIKWWLLNRGPMIVGTIWTTAMMTPDCNNVITPSGEVLGGHAYLLNEWRKDNYIGIQNSWGKDWGVNGKAYISEVDFEKLFIRDGEALAAVEVDKLTAKPRPCPIGDFFRKVLK